MTLNILIEGWLDVPHSYAIVNIYQILALLKKGYINVYLDKVPKYNAEWPVVDLDLLVTPQEKKALESLNKPMRDTRIDIIYRISYPINVCPGTMYTNSTPGSPILVFYTSEFQTLPDSNFCYGFKSGMQVGFNYFLEQCKNKNLIPITPSKWSSMALERNGYKPLVIPHGVDINKYFYSPELKQDFRSRYDIPEDSFVFLNIGAATQNKNVKAIIKAFYKLVLLEKDVYLVLKGIEDLYSCEDRIMGYIKELITEGQINKKRWKKVRHRMIYIPDTFDYTQMNELYNGCDCYVSPYIAEGFNMPVLESLACGLPVIVSEGGPTRDFTNEDVALYPKTVTLKTTSVPEQYLLITDDLSLQEKMLYALNNPDFVSSVHKLGPELVAEKFTWDTIMDHLLSFLNLVEHENYVRSEASKYNLKRIKN